MSSTPILPISFSFRCLQQNQLTWTLTNAAGAPVTNQTVTATLYTGRSLSNPNATPGTVADPAFNDIALAETVVGTSGIYVGTIAQAFNPLANLGTAAMIGFVVEITQMTGSTIVNTWNIPAVIVPAQSENDLVLLDDVKTWLGIPLTNTNDDRVLQLLISSFSEYVVQRTGRSDLSSINAYTETYDGNGNNVMFVRNPPIQSLIFVTIAGYNVPQSLSTTTSGIYIEQEKKSIAFRNSRGSFSPPFGIYPYYFTPGKGNVQISYTGGYASTPYDLYECAMKICALNYKRKDWVDLSARNLGVSGSSGGVRYRDWARPPECEEILQHYQRWARP